MSAITQRMKPEQRIKTATNWLYEAQWAARGWRSEAWRDAEMYDGDQWSDVDWERAEAAGIEPITINRTFPVIQLLLGNQAINRFESTVKGRTNDDAELAQIMTEGLHFIMDQCEGEYIVSQAWRDLIVPGIGWVEAGLESDPRKERISVKYRDWKEVGWDPFSSPWVAPNHTRYVYWQRWMDLEDLQTIFPGKRKELEEQYAELTEAGTREYSGLYEDEADHLEEEIRQLAATQWIDVQRQRVKPCEMWYPVPTMARFALFPDGRCYEITPDMPGQKISCWTSANYGGFAV